MYFGAMNINTIPCIGFAMLHYNKRYKSNYKSTKKSVEIAYINSGKVNLILDNKKMTAEEGCVIVIFRHIPVSIETVEGCLHSHYTVLGEFDDYEFKLLCENISADNGDLIVPFVTPPSLITEKISKELRQISVDMETDREKNSLSCAVKFLSILCELSENRHNLCQQKSGAHSRIASCVCGYVCENLDKTITLRDLSDIMKKSPNYIGSAFKKEKNMTVAQYINIQKAKRISELILREKISFKDACAKVAFPDVAYGYKIFKRYMGVTPGEYLKIKTLEKN